MKISTLMKDYLGTGLLKEQSIHRSVLPQILSIESDLPLEPYKSEWSYISDPERLRRLFKFADTRQRSLFVEELLNAEDTNGHSAKITITGSEVLVEVWTHDINTVTELDKEYASMCDELYNDVSLIGFDHHEY